MVNSKYSVDELYHYGVKGMKWGIRRYQNYDGSLTQKGVARYKKAVSDYESSKSTYKKGKTEYKEGRLDKIQLKTLKKNMIKDRDSANRIYKNLKYDKLADKGKDLYRRGKTITNNSARAANIQTGIAIGSVIANRLLANKYGNTRMTQISSASIFLGGSAVNGVLYLKTQSDNKKLRAYYGHKKNN